MPKHHQGSGTKVYSPSMYSSFQCVCSLSLKNVPDEAVKIVNPIKSWPQGPVDHTLRITCLGHNSEGKMWLTAEHDSAQSYVHAMFPDKQLLFGLQHSSWWNPHCLTVSAWKMNFKFLTNLPECKLFLGWELLVLYKFFSKNKIAQNGKWIFIILENRS